MEKMMYELPENIVKEAVWVYGYFLGDKYNENTTDEEAFKAYENGEYIILTDKESIKEFNDNPRKALFNYLTEFQFDVLELIGKEELYKYMNYMYLGIDLKYNDYKDEYIDLDDEDIGKWYIKHQCGGDITKLKDWKNYLDLDKIEKYLNLDYYYYVTNNAVYILEIY